MLAVQCTVRCTLCADMEQCKMTVNAVFGSLRENLIL